MAQNLEDSAENRLTKLRDLSGKVGAALGSARAQLNPRPIADARTALAKNRAEQDRIRAQLAAVDNPSDIDTLQNDLRAAMIAEAGLRVQLRRAQETVAAAEAAVVMLSELIETANVAVGAAETELKTATRRQADGADLRERLAKAPLNTLVADATAARNGPAFTAAENRLAALLPDVLRTRARDRLDEADDVGTTAAAHAAAGQTRQDTVRTTEAPLQAKVEATERKFEVAEVALRRYVHTAPAELAASTTALTALATLPGLSAAQQAALDPAAHADAVAAATKEKALATAVATLASKQRAVDDAIVDALINKPDADPQQDPAVKAAIDARDHADVQTPLATARGDYNAAARAALDAWEVEVPLRLWRGLADLAAATSTLERLADQAARDQLVSDLDTAQDALAAALDERDEQLRRGVALGLALAPRTGAVAAAGAAPADRTGQYLRGDGPGGRTPEQL